MAKIKGIYVEIKGDTSHLQTEMKKARDIVKKQTKGISDAFNNVIPEKAVRNSVNRLVADLNQLKRAANIPKGNYGKISADLGNLTKITGMTERQFQSLQSRMLDNQAAERQRRALENISRAANLSRKETKELGRQMGLTKKQMEGLHWTSRQTAKGFDMIAASARGFVAGLSVYAVSGAARSILDAKIQVDSLERSFEAVAGSASSARKEMAAVKEMAERYGHNFYDVAKMALGLMASSEGTRLQGTGYRKLLEASLASGTVFGMSPADIQGVLRAFTQMLSKGKVQAEELRGQLGERLYGAFQLAAKAMGVTNEELNKMLEQGKIVADDILPLISDKLMDLYDAAGRTAGLESGRAAVNALSQEWTSLKNNIGSSEAMFGTIRSLAGGLKALNNLMDGEKHGTSVDMARMLLSSSPVYQLFKKRQDQSKLKEGLPDYKFRGKIDRNAASPESNKQHEVAKKALDEFYKDQESEYAKVWKKWDEVLKQIFSLKPPTDIIKQVLKARKKDLDEARKSTPVFKYTERLGNLQDELKELQLKGKDLDVYRVKKDIQEQEKVFTDFGFGVPEELEIKKKLKLSLVDTQANEEVSRKRKALDDQLAQLTKDEYGYKRYKLAVEVQELRSDGSYDPKKIEEFRSLSLKKINEEEQAAIAKIEEGKKKANEKLLAAEIADIKRVAEANMKVQQEVSDQYKKLKLGDTKFAIEQLRKEAAEKKAVPGVNANEVDAVYGARIGEIEARAQEEALRTSLYWKDGLRRGLGDYAKEASNMATAAESAVVNSFMGMEHALTQFVTTGKANFSDLVNSIVSDIVNMSIRMSITAPLAGVFSSFLGGMGASAFSATLPGFFGFAAGGVPNAQGLSAYRNKVVDRPTIFPFAKGGTLGLMGEAGSEAIMPLKRLSGGELGVRAETVAPNIQVNIHESAGVETEVRTSDDGMTLDVFVQQIEGAITRRMHRGQGLAQSLDNRYGRKW